MNKLTVIAGALALGFAATSATAQTLKFPVNDAPITEKWFPTKWGADDKAGSANHVKNAASMKRTLAPI
jgi:hypothetical protein